MTTKKTPTKVQAQPCSASTTVCIPRSLVSSIHEKLMTGTALVLAMHRLKQSERDGCTATPAELVLWQAFNAVLSATEALGHAAGYMPEESVPE